MINRENVLQRFFDYVKIDSETGFEKEMADRLVTDFKALGMTVEIDDIGEAINSTGYNVYARLDGDESKDGLLFSSHMDTVVPGKGIEPYIEDGMIKSRGNTILGGDDKSGIVGIMEAIKTIKENNLSNRPIEVLITVREESGLMGSKFANYDRIKATQGVVLDSGSDVGVVMLSAPGQIAVKAEFIGRKSHAGVAPEAGISAIQIAARAIDNMKLLRIDEETTANIGVIKSEFPTNIVADSCIISAEARSRNAAKLKAQGDHMVEVMEKAAADFGAEVKYEIITSYECYATNPEETLPTMVKEKIEKLGLKAEFRASGGGSDANIFNQKGIKAVVLATGMDKVHTTNEQITVENLVNTARLCLELML